MTHDLKTLAEYWDSVDRGKKTFEVRKDDRGFRVGDWLSLIRMDGGVATPDESGQFVIERRVTYILNGGQFGIERGYVVMGLSGGGE